VPATPPAGWTGYFSLYEGPAAQDPGCGGLYPDSAYTGNNGISVPPANCSTCTCTAPQGQTCQVTGMQDPQTPANIDPLVVLDASCSGAPRCGTPLDTPPTWTGNCIGNNYVRGKQNTCQPSGNNTCDQGSQPCNLSVIANPLKVTGGSCTASTQTPTIPPVGWSNVGEACGSATPGTGCSASQTCLPTPLAPFHPGVCIMHDGEIDCPGGKFSEQHIFYTGKTDTRGCTACTCDAPTGGSCSATVTIYKDDSTCSTTPWVTLHPTSSAGDCQPIPDNNSDIVGRKAVFSPVTGGSCTPVGGQPTGTAAPDKATATTFCCIP
jgi:hypothetical protein